MQESSPLLVAAEAGQESAITALLKGGALPNAPDFRGASPLMRAAGQGHCGCIEILLAHGAGKCSHTTTHSPVYAAIYVLWMHQVFQHNTATPASSMSTLEAPPR